MNEQMIRKNNMRIFPIYQMFSWDLLFYYAISFLFLVQVKGFTPSQILLSDACYPIFKIIFQILCMNFIDKLGKQKSLLLGNILVGLSMLIFMLGNSIFLVIFSYFIMAIGYNFKECCEPTFLSDSIPESKYSSNIYSKINSKGMTLFYILDAISAILTGFLFVINPYIPMILCFVCCLLSTIICLGFQELPISKINKTSKLSTFSSFLLYFKDLIATFKQIIKSNRLKCLLVFSACFYSILGIYITLRSSILLDIGVPEQYFGLILAIMQIISSISSRNQQWFHKKLKNRVLSYFSLSVAVSFIITGLLVIFNISFTVSLIASLLTVFIIGIIKGPYYTLILRYFNSFSNPSINTKIYAVKSFTDNILKTLLSLFVSFLLGITTTAYTFVIIGCISFVVFIFLLDYMKTKVGLKPEKYPKEDLIFSEEK